MFPEFRNCQIHARKKNYKNLIDSLKEDDIEALVTLISFIQSRKQTIIQSVGRDENRVTKVLDQMAKIALIILKSLGY